MQTISAMTISPRGDERSRMGGPAELSLDVGQARIGLPRLGIQASRIAEASDEEVLTIMDLLRARFDAYMRFRVCGGMTLMTSPFGTALRRCNTHGIRAALREETGA